MNKSYHISPESFPQKHILVHTDDILGVSDALIACFGLTT